MKVKRFFVFVLLIIIACSTIVGCGKETEGATNVVEEEDIKKNGIRMENYLTLYTKGQDGYAKLGAYVDFDRLKEDCSKFLVDDVDSIGMVRPGCETIKDYLDYVFKHTENRDVLECEHFENLGNGDVVKVTVNVPIDLEKILDVEIHSSVVSYEIKGLKEFKKIDPYNYAGCNFTNLVSVNGKVGYNLSDVAKILIVLPDGEYTYVYADVDVSDDQIFMPGDTVHMSLDEETIKSFEEKYGDILTRTEGDVKLDKMGYLPTGSTAKDAFQYLDEAALDNVDYATKTMMDWCTKSDTTVERVGMMFFYDAEGTLEKYRNDSEKNYNQLVFIYKISNETNPNGWYTYMGYGSSALVGYKLNKATIKYEKAVGNMFSGILEDRYGCYDTETDDRYNEFPTSFECNGMSYPGHKDLKDVFAAIEKNREWKSLYDHLIVTDDLKNLVTEY